MQLSKRGLLLTASALFFWLGMLVLGLEFVNSPWEGWQPATCMPSDCFCEAIGPTLIKQPINTISSFLFVVVGFVIAIRPLTTWQQETGLAYNHDFHSNLYSTIYASALILLGLGSAFFHASLTFAGQTADVLGMYLLITFPLTYNLRRLLCLPAGLTAWIYGVGNALLLWGLIAMPEIRRQIFAVLVILVLALEIVVRLKGYRSNPKLIFGSLGLVVGGFALWVLDISGTVCMPTSLVQGHALWHAAGAGSAALLYAYLEQSTQSTSPSLPSLSKTDS